MDYKNIIIRMPNWIGDIVMATSILKDVRNQFKSSKITVLCKKPMSQLLHNNPYIDEIISFEKAPYLSFNKKNRKLIKLLKSKQYDLGVLMTNSFSSAWLFYRSNIKHIVGYRSSARGWMLHKPVKFCCNKDKQHLVYTYKNMIKESLDIKSSSYAPQLFVNDKEKDEALTKLIDNGYVTNKILVGINVAAAYGQAKCWLPDRFFMVAKHLLQKENVFVVFVGDTNSNLINNICAALTLRAINLSGKTSIRELMAIISRCDVFLTNDSGPMHVADAIKTPVVAIFGSTSPVITGPFNGGTVIKKDVKCSPCFRRKCNRNFACMKMVGVDEVVHTIERILKDKDNV
jgi:heptosyltransferase II